MSPTNNKKNIFMHDCLECEESYIETCESCMSDQNPIKDPHACRCAILSYCMECYNLSERIKNVRASIAKMEESNAPKNAIQLARRDLENMLEAIHSFDV